MRTHITIFFLCHLSSLNAQESPNLLEPIPPPIWSGHVAKGVEKLVGNWRSAIWMVSAPAFDGEHSVSIRRVRNMKGGEDYSVEYAKSSRPFLAPPPPPPPPGSSKSNIQEPQIKIFRCSKFLSPTVATKVIHVWTEGMKTTRYSGDQPMHIGLDGVSYFFFASPMYFGQIWCPSHGVSQAMVDLAGTLIEFAKSVESSPKPHEANIEKACEALQSQINLLSS